MGAERIRHDTNESVPSKELDGKLFFCPFLCCGFIEGCGDHRGEKKYK